MGSDSAAPGHVGIDELAELEEGLLEPAAAQVARAHLEDCPECRDRLSRLRTTRALLSTLPADAMPAAVSDRVDAAVAQAAAAPIATVVPAARRRRFWSSPAVAGGAAAAAVVVLLAALVAGNVIHRSGHGTTAINSPQAGAGRSNATAAKAADVRVWSTDANYTPATIATLVPKIVTGTPPPAATENAPNLAPSPAASTGGNAAGFSRADLRASRAALLACGHILAAGAPVVPVAVDFARFDGKPAVIFALPAIGHAESLDVWVVRSACSASSLDVYFQRIARPG